MHHPHRRHVVAGLLSTLLPVGGARAAALSLGPPSAFSFDGLAAAARDAASQPFQPAVTPDPAVLDQLDYDNHWRIRYKSDEAAVVGGQPVEFFHLGRYAREPVTMHLLENGTARRLDYSPDLFSMPANSPARALSADAGFAGLRIMRQDGQPDWISALGASYFRCDGPDGQYGMSARGLAIDTGLASGEEFPRFSAFWVGPPENDGEDVVIYARLTSQSVEGAYRIAATYKGSEGQVCVISARLFFRQGVNQLGVAPLTSMYWYSRLNRQEGNDWRPQIHDSDGLALEMATGERIWRPLRNPLHLTTASFFDASVKGFGLSQRDRAFENYQDDGVFYNRRPSVWITPLNDWGEGAVQLVEIPTNDEILDNIVAHWTPGRQPEAGSALSFDYRQEWRARDPAPTLGRTVATWRGSGGVPGQPRPLGVRKFVIDFEGGPLEGLGKADEESVTLSITTSGGEILRHSAYPVVGTKRWRGMFDLDQATGEAVELRAYLRRDNAPLTETWSFLSAPAAPSN